jgi:hypothetical protein
MELPSSVDAEADGMNAKFRKSKRDMMVTFPLSVS